MDNDLITVKILINEVSLRSTLINTGCKYYSIMDKDFIIKLRFLHVKIPPNPITGFVKKNTKEPRVEITKIAKFFINIMIRLL